MTRTSDMLGSWNDLCNEDNTTCAIAEISKKATDKNVTWVKFYTSLKTYCPGIVR